MSDDWAEKSLFEAAKDGKFNLVKNLISHGLDVNYLDSEHNLAVDYAWRNQFYKITLLLLEADSCFPKDFDCLQLISDCDKNDETNLKNFAAERNLLHNYIENDDLKNVQKIVSKSRSKFYLSDKNESAAFTALKCKKIDILAYLTSIGAEFLNHREKEKIYDLKIKDKFALREANVIHFPPVSEGHIDYLLSKSRSKKPVEGSREQLRIFYSKLDQIPEVSIILKVVQYCDYLDVVFDFDEEHVMVLNPLSSKNTRGETDYKEERLYIAASFKRGERTIMGTIAHELTHMAMELLFQNECNPYLSNDKNGKENFQKITDKTIFNNVDNDCASKIISNVRGYEKSEHPCEIIVTVPQILVQYNYGKEWLQENAFELFNFYTEIIIPKCHEFISSSPALKSKHKIRTFNESLGEIVKLRKLNLNFENVDFVRNFFNSEDKNIFIFKTKYPHLGMVKVLQAIFGPNYITEFDKYLALNFENLMFKLKEVMLAYLNGCEKLILRFNHDPNGEKLTELVEVIWEIFQLKPNKKMILIIHPNMEEDIRKTLQRYKFFDICAHQTDEPIFLYSLDEKSQNVILSKNITFQGMRKSLKDFIKLNENFLHSINGNVIEDLIKGEVVLIGSRTRGHHNLDNAFGYVYEEINMKSLIRELKCSNDTFVFYGLKKEDEFIAYFNEYINEGLIDLASIVSQIQIINSEHFEIANKKLLLTDRFSDGDIRKLCLHNRRKTIYFIEIKSNFSFMLKQFYNPGFYLERKFKVFVTNRRELKIWISSEDYFSDKKLFIISQKKDDFKLGIDYDNVLSLNVKEAENVFNDFIEDDMNAVVSCFPHLQNKQRFTKKEITIHWFHAHNLDEIYWINSLGCITSLQERFKNNFLIKKEEDIIENLVYKKVLLIADNPGMGKSTTLSKLYESFSIAETHWAIRIDLKKHLNKIKKIDTRNFSINDLIAFLLKIKPDLDNKLSEELLKSILTTEAGFGHCLLAFDGFDEILDEEYREKVIFLLKYIQMSTKGKIWVTTRLQHKKQLEFQLSTLALGFDPIDNKSQELFVKKFFQDRLKLILEPELVRDIFDGHDHLKDNSMIWIYTEKFLEYMKNIFQKDVSTFIGTPLQLNLMTENSEDHFKTWVKNENKNLIDFSYLGKNILEVYEKFIDKKYEIYFRKQNIKEKLFQQREKEYSKHYHKALAESLNQNKHLDLKWHKVTPLMLLVGLIQSNGTSLNVQFIHFTFREYFFAFVFTDHIMDYLNNSFFDKNIRDFYNKILRLREQQLVRRFINMQLEKFNMNKLPKEKLAFFAELFCSSWEKRQPKLNHLPRLEICWKSKAIFWDTVEEKNENIFNLIFFACEELMTSGALYFDLVTMMDSKNYIFLHRAIFNKNFKIFYLLFEKMEKLRLYQQKKIIEIRNIDHGTILHLGVESGDLKTVEFLFKKLEKLLSSDELQSFLVEKVNGKNVLYKAREKCYTEIVSLLLEKSNDILLSTDKKKFIAASHDAASWLNPLFKDVKNDYTDTIEMLLQAEDQLLQVEEEKSVSLCNDNKYLTMDYAWRNKFYDIVLLLLKADSHFPKEFNLLQLEDNEENLKNFVQERTLLHKCIEDDDLDSVKKIVSGSQSKFYLNQQNQSAIFTSAKCERFNVYDFLKSIGADFLNDDERQKLINLVTKKKPVSRKPINFSSFPSSSEYHENLAVDYAWENKFYDVVLILLSNNDSRFPKEFNLDQLDDNESAQNLKKFVEDRRFLHKCIEDDDLENVKNITSKSKSKFYLNDKNESARYTALKWKRFNIEAYLKSIGVEFYNDCEKTELRNIIETKGDIPLEEVNITRGVSEDHINYLMPKSRSQKTDQWLINFYFLFFYLIIFSYTLTAIFNLRDVF